MTRAEFLGPVDGPPEEDERTPGFDPGIPAVGRVYDAILGGKDNFAVDRAMAYQLSRAYPLIAVLARENREFVRRAVGFGAGSGIRQIIDLGSGIPGPLPVHDVANSADAGDPGGVRVVYVDHDPVVLRHAGMHYRDGPVTVRAVGADLCDADATIAAVDFAGAIDWDRPIMVLAAAVLHFLADPHPAVLLNAFQERAVPGSLLGISHALAGPEMVEIERIYRSETGSGTARTHAEIAALLTGMALVEPGLVPVDRWHNPGGLRDFPLLAAVAWIGGPSS